MANSSSSSGSKVTHCEYCNTAFVPLLCRKKRCDNCFAYYCSDCVTSDKPLSQSSARRRGGNILNSIMQVTSNLVNNQPRFCIGCKILRKRPLVQSDVITLHVKMLRRHLKARNVNMSACVEKKDLVELVMSCESSGSTPTSPRERRNSFPSNYRQSTHRKDWNMKNLEEDQHKDSESEICRPGMVGSRPNTPEFEALDNSIVSEFVVIAEEESREPSKKPSKKDKKKTCDRVQESQDTDNVSADFTTPIEAMVHDNELEEHPAAGAEIEVTTEARGEAVCTALVRNSDLDSPEMDEVERDKLVAQSSPTRPRRRIKTPPRGRRITIESVNSTPTERSEPELQATGIPDPGTNTITNASASASTCSITIPVQIETVYSSSNANTNTNANANVNASAASTPIPQQGKTLVSSSTENTSTNASASAAAIPTPKQVNTSSSTSASPRKFAKQSLVRIEELKGVEDLEELSVQQMKDLLRMHRITYDHVLEKEELLILLKRLWRHVQKMKEDKGDMEDKDLCVICMDNPIDCVMLECGHLCTCTDCGKQMAECPLCRQYVVRIIKTFKS